MLLLEELPLRGAAGLEKGICCFWRGSCRCAGLLDYRKEVAVSRGSPAARGCSIREKEMLLLEELPLRGVAGLQKGSCCFWRGSCRCAGLLDYRKEVAVSRGSPAARGCWNRERKMLLLTGELPLRRAACWNRERKMLLLGELPLRGAARLREGGISVSRGAAAARGCWITERKMRLLGDLPLCGAARLQKRR